MSRRARVGTAACAALALALPLQAQAATTHGTARVAAALHAKSTTTQTGFATVARAATQPVLVGSDAVGSVYAQVGGTLVRYAADGTSSTVTLPGTGPFAAATAPGAVYLVQNGHVYRLSGSTWTDLALPSSVDGWSVARVRMADTDRAGEVWVSVTLSRPSAQTATGTEDQSTVAHFDGTRWSVLPGYISTHEGTISTTGMRVVDGFPVVSTFLAVHYGQRSVLAWNGTKWTALPGIGALTETAAVFRSRTTYTAWARPFSPVSPVADVATCARTVNGTTTTTCFAPQTPVVDAVLLADGRSVVATRASRTNPAAGAGAFYLLGTDDTTATLLPGSTNGATSVDLVAEPTGGGVWAVTPDGAGAFIVQRAEIAPVGKVKGPKKPRRVLPAHVLAHR